MPRHPLFRAFLLCGFLVSLLAAGVLLVLALGRRGSTREHIEVVCELDLSRSDDPGTALLEARDVLRERLVGLGAAGIVARRDGDRRVFLSWNRVIEEPEEESAGPETDTGLDPRTQSALERTGRLEFLVVAKPEMLRDLGTSKAEERSKLETWLSSHPDDLEGFHDLAPEAGGPTTGLRWVPYGKQKDTPDGVPLVVRVELLVLPRPEWIFRSRDLDRVGFGRTGLGYPAVDFELARERKAAFGDFTERFVDHQLAIVIDGEIVTAPVINSKLPGGGIIEGGAAGFTKEEVQDLIAILRSGELPARPWLVSASTSLGPAGAGSTVLAFMGVGALILAIAFLIPFVTSLRTQPPAPSTAGSDR